MTSRHGWNTSSGEISCRCREGSAGSPAGRKPGGGHRQIRAFICCPNRNETGHEPGRRTDHLFPTSDMRCIKRVRAVVSTGGHHWIRYPDHAGNGHPYLLFCCLVQFNFQHRGVLQKARNNSTQEGKSPLSPRPRNGQRLFRTREGAPDDPQPAAPKRGVSSFTPHRNRPAQGLFLNQRTGMVFDFVRKKQKDD